MQNKNMKFNRYFLMLATASVLALPSCKDDEVAFIEDDQVNTNPERLFMPMFRQQTTTNKSVDVDAYACDIASKCPYSTSTHVNDIQLYWYGVNGASGYRIVGVVQGRDWNEPSNYVIDKTVGPDELSLLVEDLAYSTGYHFSIQALSPKGEQYNSKWFGRGDSSHQSDQTRTENNAGAINTGDRYAVPGLVWTEAVEMTSVRVCFNLDASANNPANYGDLASAVDNGVGAPIVDENGNWLLDEIKLEPSSDNGTLPTLSHKLTAEDYANGYCDFPACLTAEEKAAAEASGTKVGDELLASNAAYIVNGFNNKAPRYYDRNYNATMIRMQGIPGDPILVEHIVAADDTMRFAPYCYGLDNPQYSRLDTIIGNYMSDNAIAEGQIYELEGGKEYYFRNSVSFTKGLTLRTRPEDVAAGKRATVYLGIGYSDEKMTTPNATTLMLSRNAQSSAENGVALSILPIKFENINFVVATAVDYNEKTYDPNKANASITGNYFMNMYSQGLSFTLSELSVEGCSFRGLTRGFVRFQGPNRQLIENFNVIDCLWYNCGPYDTNGRGYSYFAGPGNNAGSNFYKNLVIKGNTMLDCPKHAFVSENGNQPWPATTQWHITIENNTFVNLSQRSKSASHGLFLETRYAPSKSVFTVKKNLFVQVKKSGDADAVLYCKGMRIDNHDVRFDFADNYATTVPSFTGFKGSDGSGDGTALIDGLFNDVAFSNSNYGAGYNGGELNVGGFGETRIKFGNNQNENESDAVGYALTPEELFEDPQPTGAYNSAQGHNHHVAGFYYKSDSKVQNHPIVTKNIGDTRWQTKGSFDGWYIEKKY